jgi:hypothetical protein
VKQIEIEIFLVKLRKISMSFFDWILVKETDPNPFVVFFFLYQLYRCIMKVAVPNGLTQKNLIALASGFANFYLSYNVKNWIFISTFIQTLTMAPMIYKFSRVVAEILLYNIVREQNVKEMLRELSITQDQEDFLINILMVTCGREMKN